MNSPAFYVRHASLALVAAIATGCGGAAHDESVGDQTDGPTAAVPEALGATFVAGTVPWYSEFGTDNPNHYYWCGHAALKVVGQYITGTTKTLGAIQNTFWYNSAGFRADTYCAAAGMPGNHWCASAQDVWWAAQLAQNGGYGRSNSIVKSVSRDPTTFFNQIKASTSWNYPAIIPSAYKYGGHFWIVVGYNDTGTASTSTLYMRDTVQGSNTSKYDHSVAVSTFLNATQTPNANIQIVYVK
jgi:hypothetical protein